jgi:hypothetical protein
MPPVTRRVMALVSVVADRPGRAWCLECDGLNVSYSDKLSQRATGRKARAHAREHGHHVRVSCTRYTDYAPPDVPAE